MNQYFLSPYILRFKDSQRTRKGYLLKIQTKDIKEGYADIHPWEEWGDPCWSEIPERLKENKAWLDLNYFSNFNEEQSFNNTNHTLSTLLQKSLIFALRDGKARRDQFFLLQNIKLDSHYTVVDFNNFNLNCVNDIIANGFKRIKIKVGANPNEEIQFLHNICSLVPEDIKIRLDFNTKATTEYLNNLQSLKEKIEFIEDPFLTPQAWDLKWSFAYDQPPFDISKVNVDWQILKPAKNKIQKHTAIVKDANLNLRQLNRLKTSRKIIFTSYLDHPVGMAHAFYEASLYGEQENAYGLLTHNLYEENEFFDFISVNGPSLSFTGNYGIGFDKVLNGQRWLEL